MRILFTGASSCTGYWFVRELVAAGHQVIAACRGVGSYEGVRAARMEMVRAMCETHFDCRFGSEAFLALVRGTPGGLDVMCHHGAEVADYRSPDFDPYRAAATNLFGLPAVMRALKDRGCGRLPRKPGRLAERVRRAVIARLNLGCELELTEQTEFPEPPVRINTDLCDAAGVERERCVGRLRHVLLAIS